MHRSPAASYPQDNSGLLHVAVHAANKYADKPDIAAALLPLIEQLLARGAQPDLPGTRDRWSALHLACHYDLVDIAHALIEAGAKVEAHTGCDRRPLHLAAQNGAFACAALLLESGADPAALDCNGKTPLDLLSPAADERLRELLRTQMAPSGGITQASRLLRRRPRRHLCLRRRLLAALLATPSAALFSHACGAKQKRRHCHYFSRQHSEHYLPLRLPDATAVPTFAAPQDGSDDTGCTSTATVAPEDILDSCARERLRTIPCEDLVVGARIGSGGFGEVLLASWGGAKGVCVKKVLEATPQARAAATPPPLSCVLLRMHGLRRRLSAAFFNSCWRCRPSALLLAWLAGLVAPPSLLVVPSLSRPPARRSSAPPSRHRCSTAPQTDAPSCVRTPARHRRPSIPSSTR